MCFTSSSVSPAPDGTELRHFLPYPYQSILSVWSGVTHPSDVVALLYIGRASTGELESDGGRNISIEDAVTYLTNRWRTSRGDEYCVLLAGPRGDHPSTYLIREYNLLSPYPTVRLCGVIPESTIVTISHSVTIIKDAEVVGVVRII